MKKALILLSLLAMIITTTTGCKKLEVVEIKNQNIDTILASVLEGKQKLYNTSSLGYKFYVPRGMKILTKNQYNTVMKYQNDKYYLYTDLISYYYKTLEKYQQNEDAYYSKEINYDGKTGYLEINEIKNQYLVEMMYNYAKIESYVTKENLNSAIINGIYLLTSVSYNDQVIETMVGDNVLNYGEETFNIFKPKKESSSLLEWGEDIYYDVDNELPDPDKIVTNKDE